MDKDVVRSCLGLLMAARYFQHLSPAVLIVYPIIIISNNTPFLLKDSPRLHRKT